MAQPTERDRETAQALLGLGELPSNFLTTVDHKQVSAIAAALADERARARQPFLAIIAELADSLADTNPNDLDPSYMWHQSEKLLLADLQRAAEDVAEAGGLLRCDHCVQRLENCECAGPESAE